MISGLSTTYMALAGLLPVVVVLALGGWTIRILRNLKAGQRVRDDGPQRHLQKEGTPTMGGVLIVLALVLGVLVASQVAFHLVSNRVLLVIGLTVVMGAVGFADDYLKIKRGRSLGLKAREKLLGQIVAAIVFVALLTLEKRHGAAAEGSLFTRMPTLAWQALWVLAVVGTANAVNLADGLDGLATGLCIVAGLGFAVLAELSVQPYVVILGLAMAGVCLGFLWFNRHPARVFMGDVGSLALGGALVGMAAVLDTPLALIGLCLVPFIEAASVMIQVISFKTTGKRVFKMSPIHHHFDSPGGRSSGWYGRSGEWGWWWPYSPFSSGCTGDYDGVHRPARACDWPRGFGNRAGGGAGVGGARGGGDGFGREASRAIGGGDSGF